MSEKIQGQIENLERAIIQLQRQLKSAETARDYRRIQDSILNLQLRIKKLKEVDLEKAKAAELNLKNVEAAKLVLESKTVLIKIPPLVEALKSSMESFDAIMYKLTNMPQGVKISLPINPDITDLWDMRRLLRRPGFLSDLKAKIKEWTLEER